MVRGVFAVDKESGPTSQRVLNLCKDRLRTKKLGHSGTLDPLASGLLVVAAGPSTRLLSYITGAEKRYLAHFVLGVTTDTYDITGVVLSKSDASGIGLSDVLAAKAALEGEIQQCPPRFSAIHVDGRRAYDLARKNVEFEIEPRSATVYGLDIDENEDGSFLMSCHVSSGTYVRSLIFDLGQILGVGATMTALRRTHVGAISLEKAKKVESLSPDDVLSPKEVFPLDVHLVLGDDREISNIRNGRSIALQDSILHKVEPSPLVCGVRAFLYEGNTVSFDGLLAVGEVSNGLFAPKVVMPGGGAPIDRP
ncbi:tRNA pseudouridine55 synthase [Ferrithrix thermotolerans DSM 19514]|jgi:tRNA pseudouridine55 synthase|uniref:tRNA pseudouridine synthase B n=1 Tax=Ferrithrix thermotolerans DSM 19514 TaxID=1121881 RepID=A0A1M4TNY7_9ACTN|nr:tRNA pseudouridine(55) synthase TruB [Ferrithrix thermotolerans]SHE46229.1 tRNA pseudouridine55 synthase [Ferrithrix thermotolerans DSM 19514]